MSTGETFMKRIDCEGVGDNDGFFEIAPTKRAANTKGDFVTAKLKGADDFRQGWVISTAPLIIRGQKGNLYECEGVATVEWLLTLLKRSL